MSIDLALVFPRLRYQASGDPPLGVASIAAYVRSKGYRVAIVDGTRKRDFRQVADEVVRCDPEFVGIYTGTLMLPDASRVAGRIRVLDQFRGRKRTLVAGGPHVTVRPDDGKFLQADYVVQGEGEYAMVAIMEGRAPREEKPDLATLPTPALDLLDMRRYIDHWHYGESALSGLRGTNVCASRGCPFSCSFCSDTLTSLFGRKVRYVPPIQVAMEIAQLHRDYDVRGIMLHDDQLTANKKWLWEFGKYVVRTPEPVFWFANARVDCLDEETVRFIATHNCRGLHLGVEAASAHIRNGVYQKGTSLAQIESAVHLCRKYRISPSAFFMLGAPGETREDIEATIDLACSLPLDEASFSLTVPLPGTALYDRMVQEGYEMTNDYRQYDYYHNQPCQGSLPIEDLQGLQRKALWRFYSRRPAYIARHFTSRRGIRRLLDKIGRFR